MVWSYSAPTIEPEQERQEWEAMSPEERQAIENSIVGFNSDSGSEDQHGKAEAEMRGLKELQDAIELFPEADKTAYLEAMERCPKIIKQEMNLSAFLRCEDFDSKTAASRIVHYWKMRKKIFKEKAFTRMTQREAMSDDIELLRENLIAPIKPDNHGRMVIYLNRSRMTSEVAPRDALLRVVFYVLQAASKEISKTQRNNGSVFIVNLKFFSFRLFERLYTKDLGQLVLHTFPMKVVAFHACFASSGRTIADIIYPVVKYLLGKYARHRIVSHSGDDSALLEDLKKYGLSRGVLPCEIGGDYTTEQYHKWLSKIDADEVSEMQ